MLCWYSLKGIPKQVVSHAWIVVVVEGSILVKNRVPGFWPYQDQKLMIFLTVHCWSCTFGLGVQAWFFRFQRILVGWCEVSMGNPLLTPELGWPCCLINRFAGCILAIVSPSTIVVRLWWWRRFFFLWLSASHLSLLLSFLLSVSF